MIVIPPLTVDTSSFTSSTSVDPYSYPTFDQSHTYVIGDLAYAADVDGNFPIYESLRNGNLNHYPDISENWWLRTNLIEPVWDAVTSWTLGQDLAYGNRMYTSLQAANLNHAPDTSPTWWEDIGPTNKWAMFDTLRNTATFAVSPLTVVITPGERVDTVAVLSTSADSVRLQVTNLGSSVYDHTENLLTRDVSGYYDYFFAPFVQIYSTLFLNIPVYTDNIFTITFTRASGVVSCGALILGLAVDLGITESNPVNDALNFSTVDRAFDGTAELIQRRTIPKTTQTVMADSSNLGNIIAARTALNAEPAVWAGLTDDTSDYFPSLLILGFYRQFQITLLKPNKARLSIELEEI